MKPTTPFSLALAIFFAILVASGVSAIGLDPTFGTGGKVYAQFPPGPNSVSVEARAMAVLPDGKILVAGYSYLGLNPADANLYRFNSNGTPDTTFGNNGFKWWGIQIPSFKALGMAVQSDGKILLTGPRTSGAGFVVMRVLADGTLDPTWGTSGIVTKNVGNGSGTYGIVIQQGGKVVVAGRSYTGQAGNSDITLLVRFNSDGTIDTTAGLGNDGISTGVYGAATALVLQPNGTMLTTAEWDPESAFAGTGDTNMAILRFRADISFDVTSFGNSGVATLELGNSDLARAIAVQPDGKIVAVGATRFPIYSSPTWPNYQNVANLAVVRYTSTGQPDTSFGTGGRVLLDLAYRGSDEAYSVAVDAVGNIIVGGKILVRLDPTGKIIGRTDGSSAHDPSRFTTSRISAITALSDGKILVLGDDGYLGLRIGLARYTDIKSINNTTMKFDFDGDKKAEIGVYRAGATAGADSYWYGLWSTNIQVGGTEQHFFQPRFGIGQDIAVPGDYDGDLRTDFAVFRPSDGNWYSSTRPDADLNNNYSSVHWGQSGDIPVPADFDGDGITDRAVFRPSDGAWYILNSSGGVTALQFGATGDMPVPADYDGDGHADVAVVRNVGGQLIWYILQSSDNAFLGFQFGSAGDRLVPTDYDGDGRAEIAVYRGSAGAWYLLRNYSTFSAVAFGANGDVPAPADFDGDGIADYAVFRPSSKVFYILNSHDNSVLAQAFGLSTDLPITSAYVK